MSAFNYIQTFYVNPQTVANAPEVMLTSIDVFFKAKPVRGATVSGAVAPTVNAWICEVENDSPFEARQLRNSMTLIQYDLISTSQDASSATVIGFQDPVRLATGKHYGLVLKFNDPGFDVWQNVLGDRLVTDGQITNTLSVGSRGTHGGKLYVPTNTSAHRSLSDRDLKFKVKVARYTANNITISLVNKDYEFFTIDNTNTGAFIGGEYIYQDIANATGTVVISTNSLNVIGTSTTFTNLLGGAKILVQSGGAKQILSVNAITNATHMTIQSLPTFSASGIGYKVPPVGLAYNIDYPKNKLILVDSSANATNKFAVGGGRIIGERSGATANIASIDSYPVDNFKPSFLIGNPSGSTFTLNYKIANSANQLSSTSTNINLLQMNGSAATGYILSRSVEVDTSKSSNLFGDRRKSVVANLNIAVSTAEIDRFSVPYATTRELDFYFYQNDINNVYTETRTVGLSSIADYDTETESNGLAKSKYVSKVIKFAQDKYAEDIVVYLTGYRPAGTEIKVYAKVHNAADRESFQSKAWTPLVLKDNIDRFSSTDPNDMYEFTYGFDTAPELQAALPGTGAITYGSNTITTTSNHSATVTAGDLIRIKDQDFGNHEVFVVSAANTTAIRTYRNITTSSLVSSPGRLTRSDIVIDKLKYRNVAWNNVENDNTVRYVNSGYVEFDRYTSMQIKIVLLAAQSHIVPKVEAIQVIGVSA
jgi:hypothetical protein